MTSDNDDFEIGSNLPSEPVYETDHYAVGIYELEPGYELEAYGFKYEVAYGICNKATNVIEGMVCQLPEAIGVAEQLTMLIEEKPWESLGSRVPKLLPDGSVPGDGEVH